jgi:hypothetical protein
MLAPRLWRHNGLDGIGVEWRGGDRRGGDRIGSEGNGLVLCPHTMEWIGEDRIG